jgi:hypothetical protein
VAAAREQQPRRQTGGSGYCSDSDKRIDESSDLDNIPSKLFKDNSRVTKGSSAKY